MSGKKAALQVHIKNRQAYFSYTFLDRYTVELILQETKSIRMSKASLQESYCYFNQGTLSVKGMHIATYSHGNIYNYQEKRDRQLLLQKRELQKLFKNQAKGPRPLFL